MKIHISKKAILFLALSSTLFFSCKKDEEDDQFQGDPTELKDSTHVMLNDKYGITAIFPVGEWTNDFIDTMPTDPNHYFDNYRYNAVCASLLKDSVINPKDSSVAYLTTIYFRRFLTPINSEEESEEYVNNFKKDMHDAYKGVYYTEIGDIKDTIIGSKDYKASYYIAKRGAMVESGYEYVYFMYYNQTLYGAAIKVDDANVETSLQDCFDILPTITFK